MEHPVPTLLAIAITFLAWLEFRHRYAFVVRIAPEGPRVLRGKVTPHFLRLIAEVVGQNQIERGKVYGVWQGRRIVLVFSRAIPTDCQQQLRNMWALHGW